MKYDQNLIGDEKYFFLPEDKVYTKIERKSLFKKMSRKEPKTWKTDHHIKRVFGDIIIINLNFFLVFKIYYRFCNPQLTYYQNIKKSLRLKLMLFSISFLDLLYFNYSYRILPDQIYTQNYEHLTDQQFIQLFNYVTNPTIKFFKPV